MRLRKLALAVGLAGSLASQFASALGLGEVSIKSALNEPLDAEIRLLQARDLSAQEILVSLASNADFQRAGVERLFFLSDLQFKVVVDDPSRPYVHVTSKQPVREPYLNFLLETQWPSGRILREYTLLLDLPVFKEANEVKAVSSTRMAPTKVAPAQPSYREPTRSSSAPIESSQEPESTSADSDVYGPVSANDTLWNIALKVRPSKRLSVQQTMLAIQRKNPEAFINGNINLLRKGQVLRIPDADEIRQLNGSEAVSQVAEQNSQWRQGTDEEFSAPQIDATKRRPQVVQSDTEVSGRLKLASATTNRAQEGGQGQGASESNADTERLQNELAIAEEQLDKVNRDNVELKDRIQSMEDQIQTMERLLEVSNPANACFTAG